MSDIAIRVEALGKFYRLGNRESYRTLRDTIMSTVTSPFRRLARNGSAKRANEHIWALNDVSFEVKRGDVVGIIGNNGAGKSTLLKILSRITEPTTGYAEIRGRVGSLLEVGTGFHQELTGRENIFLNGAILGMKHREITSRFDEVVSFAGVEAFLDTPVKRYSSGMYLRLAFAVAAHLTPEILMIDEVLAVGDFEFQKKCLGKVHEISRQGKTILFVSHNMHAVDQIASRCAILRLGHLVRYSDTRSAINEYLRSPHGDESSSIWTNDGNTFDNPWFTPHKFLLVDECGRHLQMPIRNDQPMFVQIEGVITNPDPALTLGYSIFTSQAQLLYSSYHTDTEVDRWPQLMPGTTAIRTRIPQRFLAESVYRLELIVTLHCREWICQPGVNAPAIQLTIQGGSSDSPYWRGARAGIIAPVIPWESARPSLHAKFDHDNI